MIRDYSFKNIEKYLKKDQNVSDDILKAFDTLSSAAIIFSPVVFGAPFLPVLELLEAKDQLLLLGHRVLDFIVKRVETDYIDRTNQIEAAYGLICYTAYFDALEKRLPKKILAELKQELGKKQAILDNSANACLPPPPADVHCELFFVDHVTSFHDIRKSLKEKYEHITHALIKVIKDTSIFDMAKEAERNEFNELKKLLEKIPEDALELYQAQYIRLADQFNDFAFFAQLQNLEGLHLAIDRNKAAIDALSSATQKIDIGLSNLNGIVNSIYTDYKALQVQEIIDDLKRKYLASIEEPIIDSKEIKSEDEKFSIKFPRIVDAFIPQSYKCLSYNSKEIHLENEAWDNLPVNNDLDKFFLKYLFSPDSVEHPLIILGHPGSGKSLLTKVLSAQLMSTSYTVVRIPLREIKAEAGIDLLIEDQIKKLTNRPLSQGYGGFASQFHERPLIVILDGYDELLQAKGDIFSGYLEKVRMFQQDQKSMGRPIRMIITSRITLIDKARMPIGSTILRLIEFDQRQRQAWIDIWNKTNSEYYAKSGIKPFSLPKCGKHEKNNLIELAEQPLLLLMLALYDSDANELAQTSDIKRTELYDNLIRRFVRRERGRYVPGFEDKPVSLQEKIIEQEMNRLGVVAIGMYNRRGVVIRSKQLESDLDHFQARRLDGSPEPQTLQESESILGGFFFIHKSTAQDMDAHSDKSESAYEFLHNTFGEFLAADFILRNTIKQVNAIYVNRKFKTGDFENGYSNPDSISSNWFFCLIFVPLYSRPVIIEMLREHAEKALERVTSNSELKFSYDIFISNLKFIVQDQLKMVLNTRNSPKIMRNGILFDRDIPLLGYLSTYSLNLITLACALSADGFEFDEDNYRNSEVSELDSKPWDKLTALWKAWFSFADLAGLSVILRAKRENDTTVLIKCAEKFEAKRYERPTDILLCVSSTLADNLLTSLSGLHAQRFGEIARMSAQEIHEMLNNAGPDIFVSYYAATLRSKIYSIPNGQPVETNYEEINEMVERIVADERLINVEQQTLLNLYSAIECALQHKILFNSTRNELILTLPNIWEERSRNLQQPSNIESSAVFHLMRMSEPFADFAEIFYGSIYADKLYDAEQYRRIDYIMRYQTRAFRDIERHAFNLERGKLYYTHIWHVLEKPTLNIRDVNMLMEYLSSNNMEIMLKTQPELLSRTILMMQKTDIIALSNYHDTIIKFLDECREQISSSGIQIFGLPAIINTINIARNVHDSTFLGEILVALKNRLFGVHAETFVYYFYHTPGFIADLINVMPEAFPNNFIPIFSRMFEERAYRFFQSEKSLDYIRVLHTMVKAEKIHTSDLVMKDPNSDEDELVLFYKRLNTIVLKTDLDALTLNQLNDLAWYADLTDNHRLLSKLRVIIKRLGNI